jgi:hypothetical protein
MSLVTGYTPSRVTQTAFGVPMSGVSMPSIMLVAEPGALVSCALHGQGSQGVVQL